MPSKHYAKYHGNGERINEFVIKLKTTQTSEFTLATAVPDAAFTALADNWFIADNACASFVVSRSTYLLTALPTFAWSFNFLDHSSYRLFNFLFH